MVKKQQIQDKLFKVAFPNCHILKKDLKKSIRLHQNHKTSQPNSKNKNSESWATQRKAHLNVPLLQHGGIFIELLGQQ